MRSDVKYVVGSGLLLDAAMAAWAAVEPGLELRRVEVDPDADAAALAAVLDVLELDGASAFAALDARFLNFRRLALVDALRARGAALPALVEPGAVVAAGTAPGDNCWIGAGAVLQHGCRVGANVFVGAGAVLASGAAAADSAWIEAGVTVGRGAILGAHATLGLGVSIGHGVEIGALCVVDRPGRIDVPLAPRTFLHASHANPMVVVGA